MAKKSKASGDQLSLLSASVEPHEENEVHEIEQRSAPDNHPALVEFRNKVLDEHCRKYPDGLCAYFRYHFRIEDHQ